MKHLQSSNLSLEDLRKLAEHGGHARQIALAEFPQVSEPSLCKLMKPDVFEKLEQRMQKASVKGGRRCKNVAHRKGGGGRQAKFANDEKELFETSKKKREAGIKVRARFVRARFRYILKANYPVGNDLHNEVLKFKTSSGWLRRFMDRHELTWRKRNNKRIFVVDKYIPGRGRILTTCAGFVRNSRTNAKLLHGFCARVSGPAMPRRGRRASSKSAGAC